MQSSTFPKILFISRNLVRSYARTARKSRTANPGMQKRLNILDEKDEQNLNDIDFEELESDFMNVGKVHLQHEKELQQYREKEKYWIIRRKYFKEEKVNFLTWSDKEQIRHLHQSNPVEWTVEKLSEGFPAFPETISKILKATWHLKNDRRRINHDKAVERNWKLLKEGKLTDSLPDYLIKHLMKFSSRQQVIEENESNKFVVNINEIRSKTKTGEFSSIITTYEEPKLKNSETKESIKHSELESKNRSSVVMDQKRQSKSDKTPVTLQMLKIKSNLPEVPQESKSPDENLNHSSTLNKKIQDEETPNTSFIFTAKNNQLIKTTKKPSQDVVPYPEKIIIPRNKYKKGSTYKLNDCYYDDDGEFLYRVPGMY